MPFPARLAAVLVLAGCAPMGPPAAAPQAEAEEVDCQMQMATLGAQTQAAVVADGQKAALVAELEAASVSLTAGRAAESRQRLAGYRSRVAALKAARNLNASDGDALIAGADSVANCLRGG